jgi:DNA-binding CsgD family transcriptional regulator
MLQTSDARALKPGALTPKERECLRLVAQQRSSKEIARELGISKSSVDTYCNRARAKLGVSNRRAAAQLMLTLEVALAEGAAASTGALQPQTASAAPTAPTVAAIAVLPSLSSLGPVARLGIILGGAVVLAVAFGSLLSGMQTLNDVVQAAQAKAAAAPHGR